MDTFKLNTIEEALADFKAGKFVIVVDDEDRENEGDLICAAEKITPEMVNFMLKNARGVLCVLLPFVLWLIRSLQPRLSVVQDTSILFMLRTMVYCAVPDIQKQPLTFAKWLVSTLPVL